MLRALTIAAVVLPLAIDTFVLGSALGAAGVSTRERLRTSLILSVFEAGMPVVGFIAGAAVGAAVGRWADYFAVAALAAIGLWMLKRDGEGGEDGEDRLHLLQTARGWTVIVLGLGVSLDELAIGFGAGLLGLPLLLLVGLIAVQAFLAAQLGMRLGSRLAESERHAGERIAGTLIVLAATLVLAERLPSV